MSDAPPHVTVRCTRRGKEGRRIFQRMNSYAIYRIAETLRVLFFMTRAILIFNFYPLTAVMIVMLALFNHDGHPFHCL
jgi:magnesium-transporting ATPase (P-type)